MQEMKCVTQSALIFGILIGCNEHVDGGNMLQLSITQTVIGSCWGWLFLDFSCLVEGCGFVYWWWDSLLCHVSLFNHLCVEFGDSIIFNSSGDTTEKYHPSWKKNDSKHFIQFLSQVNFKTISQEKLINHMIQVATFISPIVGGHHKPLKGVRRLTIPKNRW